MSSKIGDLLVNENLISQQQSRSIALIGAAEPEAYTGAFAVCFCVNPL